MNPDTTPTPRTDSAEVENANFVKVVNADLSRQLERELTEKTNEVAKLKEQVKELKENAERIGCNRFELLCKAEAKISDLLETLAAIYEKLGIKEEDVNGKELVSDTIANLFMEKTNEVARLRELLNRAIQIQGEKCTSCRCYHCDQLEMELEAIKREAKPDTCT